MERKASQYLFQEAAFGGEDSPSSLSQGQRVVNF